MKDNKQVNLYCERLNCRKIERAMNKHGLDQETTFEEIFESGEFGIDDQMDLVGM